MADETDTLAEAGTDNVTPSDDDTGSEWDYHDPDEDQDTDDETADEATDDEEGESEDTPDEESEDEPEQTAKTEAALDAVVKLADGTETTVGELTKGYLRQSDYTRKSQELAESKKAIAADASRAQRITDALIDRLAQFIPDEPDPSLAYSNPSQYTALKAQHETAVRKMQELVSIADAAKGVQGNISDQDRRARIDTENRKLAEAFPETATQEGRQKFFTEAAAAAKELGFSDQEIGREMDHRMFALAHWAKIGLAAEKARQSAKGKLAKASPSAPQKPGQSASRSSRNRDAMKRLTKSGDINDALKVDFNW